MGLIRKPAKYDEPIKNGFTDPIYEFFGGVDLREKKRRDRREARNKAMSWWYHHTHPWWGLRAVSILAGLALLTTILMQQRVVAPRSALLTSGVSSRRTARSMRRPWSQHRGS